MEVILQKVPAFNKERNEEKITQNVKRKKANKIQVQIDIGDSPVEY